MENNSAGEKQTKPLESGDQPSSASPRSNFPPQIPPQAGYGPAPGSYGPPQGNYPPPAPTNGPPTGSYGPPQGNYPPPSHANGPPPGSYPQPAGPGNYPPQPTNGPPQGGYYQPSGMPTNGPPPTNYPHQGNFGPPQGNPYGPPPVMNQPMGQGNWMVRPQGIANCPPGLEYLTMIDNLFVNQKVHPIDVAVAQKLDNEFMVTNNLGQQIYHAREEADSCSRNFCGSRRAFHMNITDNFGTPVISLTRPLACQACCFPCCLQKLEVSAPLGTTVGLIEQEWDLLYPTFAIKNPTGETILWIKGPWCTMNCYADVEFKVLTADKKTEVGKISKKWSGYAREGFTEADIFGISFPMDLDVRMKAVMLGCCFLIDMMYFDQSVSSSSNKSHNSGQDNPNPQQHQQLHNVNK